MSSLLREPLIRLENLFGDRLVKGARRAGRAKKVLEMALLDFANRRLAALVDAQRQATCAGGGCRQQSRGEIALGVGKTMLMLMLIAFCIMAWSLLASWQ
jgi:hypothetical protein